MLPKTFGRFQRDYAAGLLSGQTMYYSAHYFLRGRARQYAGRYQASLASVRDWLSRNGYLLIVTPGPHGGLYSATVQAIHVAG